MLETYTREFVAISAFLTKKGNVRKGYILIEKQQLINMLDKNKYDTAANKLKIWKALKWIDTDSDGRLTKRIYVEEDGKKLYKPYVKIDISVFEQLQKLL